MNALRNTAGSFGWLSRGLHWTTALLVIAAIGLGLFIARAEISLGTLWLFGLHKSLGLSILVLTILRLQWHGVSPPPRPLPGSSPAADRAARLVHRMFYVLLISMPIAGWIGSSATGIDTVVFGRWTLPGIAPASEAWETAAFLLHRVAGYGLILLVALHVAGAIHRARKPGDRTLLRMVVGR